MVRMKSSVRVVTRSVSFHSMLVIAFVCSICKRVPLYMSQQHSAPLDSPLTEKGTIEYIPMNSSNE
jgi:hypothetical protein